MCQYGKAWDDLTIMCRGLITDLEGRVVARPFPKFFNLAEHEEPGSKLPPVNWRQDFLALKKYDGSLGILYYAGGQPYLATRGSFTSEQAIRGTKILRAKYRAPNEEDLTFLFEIIYPGNRIVVDYGDLEELILLDVIDNQTGRGCSYESLCSWSREIGCPVADDIAVDQADPQAVLTAYAARNEANEEGIVVRFDDGMRIKVKFEEYVRLHRLITGVNARHIWEYLKDGKSLDDLVDRVPDEYMAWVKRTVSELQDRYKSIEATAGLIFTAAKLDLGAATRKEYALHFARHPEHASILFQMLDGKPYDQHIWTRIKPVSSSPFKDDPDA